MYNLEEITIAEAFQRTAGKMPDGLALEFDETSVSWKDFDKYSDCFARFFVGIGIKKGTHVAIWSFHCLEYFYAYIGLLKVGAIAAPINVCYKQPELEDILQKSDVECIVYGKEHEEISTRLDRVRLPALRHHICLNEIPFENETDQPPLSIVKSDPHEVSNILFTSGTTGNMKGVMLTHHNLFNNGSIIAASLRAAPDDKICLSVPMFHCFGVTAALMVSLASGCSICILKNFSSINVFSAVDKYKCTILNGVPTIFLAMVHKLEGSTFDLSSLRTGVIAGSGISPKDYMNVCERLGIKLLMSYGQTETSPCVSISDYNETAEQKCDNAGFVTEHVSVRIVDIKTGKLLGKNEHGEIQVKGYNVTKGYYNLPEATAEALLPDGYIKTGDIGYLDDSGRLHIVGRIKEIIIRGGENISSAEIEKCLRECDNVHDVKIIGIDAAVLQEEIAACIITKNGEQADVDMIKNYVAQRLADYKVPKYVLTFKEFPINETGKIKLGELKKLASSYIIKGKIYD